MSKIPSVKAGKQNNHTASTDICWHYSQLLKFFQFLTGKLCTWVRMRCFFYLHFFLRGEGKGRGGILSCEFFIFYIPLLEHILAKLWIMPTDGSASSVIILFPCLNRWDLRHGGNWKYFTFVVGKEWRLQTRLRSKVFSLGRLWVRY